MNSPGRPTDGGHPVLSAGLALSRSGADVGDRIRYEPAWVCRNGGCDYRELVGDA
jgi:hypothetical protein